MVAQHSIALWFYLGFGQVLLRNPIFCDFSGGPDLLSPHLDLHMLNMENKMTLLRCIIIRETHGHEEA